MTDEKVVLLVDDEQSLLKATSIGLKDRGFKVYTAESGELAIKAIQNLHPSIVVSDLAMPGMNGFELYQEVKKSHSVAEEMGAALRRSAFSPNIKERRD